MASEYGNITVDDVEKESTYMGLLRMCRQLRIQAPESNSQALREFIIHHLKTQEQPQQAGKEVICGTIPTDSVEDLRNRGELKEFFQRATLYINKLPEFFKDDLNNVFPGCFQHLKNTMEELESRKRILLVAGELASGKSSLINLLLGANILPISDLRCTAAIVEVSYGPFPYAVMHFKDDSTGRALHPVKIRSKDTNPSKAFMAELEDHITKRDPYTDDSPYDKVELQWPLEVLKDGLTIVDTPGVSDSREVIDQLAEYMLHALGLIYVIDSTSVINKHRLGQLLMRAMEVRGDFFDTDTALFVCNRLDMVPAGDLEKVKDSLVNRLSMVVPGIHEFQLHMISIKQSLLRMEYGNIGEDHRNLIEGIRQFLPRMLKEKLRVHYRYLSAILKRTLYSVRISYASWTRKLKGMHKEMDDRKERLSKLQTDGEKKLAEMRREVKMVTIEATEHILNLLHLNETRIRLATWSEAECPQKAKWREALKAAPSVIGTRIAREINHWEQTARFEDKVTNDIIQKFEQRYELLSSEVTEVQAIFLPLDEQRVVKDLHNSMRSKKRKGHEPSNVAENPDGDNLLSIGAAVGAAVDVDVKDGEIRKIFKDKYEKDPCQVMAYLTQVCLKSLTSSNVTTALTKYFNRLVKGIDEVGKLMPSMLKADQTLLQQMNQEMNAHQSGLKYYPVFSQKCQDIQGLLDMFYLEKLMEMDFTPDKLQYNKEDVLGHGTFATVYKGILKDGTKSQVVALKEPRHYISTLDVSELLLEESILREVDHENIVKYYGNYCTSRGQGKIRLNMVMEYCPYTLKDKFISKPEEAPALHGHNPQRYKRSIVQLTNLLLQIINGLCYLHVKRIVHRDIKPDNVLLTEDFVVKIADLGLAKKVKDVATQAIGTPVYIAPEVLLHGGKYNTKADIYSFGMITWQMWYGNDLAEYAARELPGDLEEAIKGRWRPSVTISMAPTQFWKNLITACWDQDPKNRPPAHDIKVMLLKVQIEIDRSIQNNK